MDSSKLDLPRPFGEYTLLRRLAVGGMAEVYVAKAVGVGGFERLVAIKVIHPRLSEDDHFVQMLIEEAKISVVLNHNNIAQCFDLGCIEDSYFIVMEFIEGADAYQMLRKATAAGKPLPVDLCSFVAAEVLRALDYAHRKTDGEGRPMGIVHRDVSPQNVLLSHNGEVKLVDFGIAKAAMRTEETEAGIIKGKYYYMSPEQAWGDPLDSRSDIFSLGIVLYELLTGTMVYQEENIPALLDKVRKAEIPPPTRLRPELPPLLSAIVERAIQKRPEHRYQTAQDMGQELRDFLFSVSPSFSHQRLSDLMGNLFPRQPNDEEEILKEEVPASPPSEVARHTKELAPMSREDFAPDVTKSVLFEAMDGPDGESGLSGANKTVLVDALPDEGENRTGEDKASGWGDHTLIDAPLLDETSARSEDGGTAAVSSPPPPPAAKALTPIPRPGRYTVPLDQALKLDETDPASPRSVRRGKGGASASGGRSPEHHTSRVDAVATANEKAPLSVPEPTRSLPPVQGYPAPVARTTGLVPSGPPADSEEHDRTQPRVMVNEAVARPSDYPFPSPPSNDPSNWAPAPADPFGVSSQPRGESPPPRRGIGYRKWIGLIILYMGCVVLAAFLVQQCRSADGPTREVRIVSDPAGARVFLDGQPLEGSTPLRITDGLEAGRDYELTVELAGYKRWRTELSPVNGVLERIARLQPLQATLKIRSIPSGAEIYIDGVYRGQTMEVVPNLPVGRSVNIRLVHPTAGERQGRYSISADNLRPEIEWTIPGP